MKPNLKRQIALDLVSRERDRQDEKWGEQRRHKPITWLSILLEEVGEVAKDVNDVCGDGFPAPVSEPQLLDEIVQVAAVAVCWIEAILAMRGERHAGMDAKVPDVIGPAPQEEA